MTPVKENNLTERTWNEDELKAALSGSTKTDLEVAKKLSSLKESYNLLVQRKPGRVAEIRLAILRELARQKAQKGVFVTSSISPSRVTEQLEESGLKPENVTIIDASGAAEHEDKNVVVIEDQSDLTDMFSQIEKALEKNRGQKAFLVFDSVSTLLVYNDEKSVEKFFNQLVQKISSYKVKALFFATKSKETESTIQTISNFCDDVVEF